MINIELGDFGCEDEPWTRFSTVSERVKLDQQVKRVEDSLREAERAFFLMADPIERQQLRKRIEAIQEELLALRLRLESLGTESSAQRERAESQAGGGSPDKPAVFISYSHADRAWVKRLMAHLKPLELAGMIAMWDDSRIIGGQPWRNEIRRLLESAQVAVLIVSADYLASDYVADEELPPLLDRASRRGVHVLPILVGPCDFLLTRLASFQFVNSPSSPLGAKSRDGQEQVLVNVADSIERLVMTPS